MSTCTSRCLVPEGAASFLIRFSIGLLFFVAGLNKFLAPGGFMAVADLLQAGFDKTWLPHFLTVPFLHVLPFIEVTLGLTLMAGVLSVYALTAAGLLLIALSFGKMVEQDWITVSNNLVYVFFCAVGIWLVAKNNVYSLDYLIGFLKDKK